MDVELPSPASGTLAEILVAEGDTVTVGQVIARIAAGSEPAAGERPDGARPGRIRRGGPGCIGARRAGC